MYAIRSYYVFAGDAARLVHGVDHAGMGAAANHHQALAGADPQRLVVGDGVGGLALGIEEA